MKTVPTLFDGETIQYTPNICIEIDYDADDGTLFHVRTRQGWTRGMTQLHQAHTLALKAMEKEAAE